MDPEPCDDCDTGISYMVCYDGIRRCRTCVNNLAAAHGWDRMPEPPAPPPAPAPPPLPPRPLDRKAIKAEKEARRAELGQDGMF